ncbi:hypothetical protein BSKO_05726 [Bryopsis sp. KO-2023]|nr:hypothetical protein BSKO_05726 [Bryopsis sp. KO-2023]
MRSRKNKSKTILGGAELDTWGQLPSDLIIQIIGILKYKLHEVRTCLHPINKHWRLVTGALVTKISVKGKIEFPVSYVAHKLNTVYVNVTTLRLAKLPKKQAHHLATLANLTTLQLNRTDTGDQSICELSTLTNLTNLGLASSRVGDVGVKSIGEHISKLKVLNLRGSRITGKGIDPLLQLKNLITLDMGGTKVNDKGARELSSLTSLCQLVLPQHTVGQETRAFLSKHLPPECKIQSR